MINLLRHILKAVIIDTRLIDVAHFLTCALDGQVSEVLLLDIELAILFMMVWVLKLADDIGGHQFLRLLFFITRQYRWWGAMFC